MNKDEQLKIYSAYLPYRLNLKSGEFITEMCASKKYIIDDYEHEFTNIDDLCYSVNHTYKPILYDLSYLTKEIEHEGEKIIPMVYFIKKTSLFDLSKCTFEVYEDDGEVYVNAHDGDRVIDSIFYDGNIFWSSKLLDIHEGYRPANPQHTWQEMLTHLHFNVFGLPEDQFINKATLTNK